MDVEANTYPAIVGNSSFCFLLKISTKKLLDKIVENWEKRHELASTEAENIKQVLLARKQHMGMGKTAKPKPLQQGGGILLHVATEEVEDPLLDPMPSPGRVKNSHEFGTSSTAIKVFFRVPADII